MLRRERVVVVRAAWMTMSRLLPRGASPMTSKELAAAVFFEKWARDF